MLFSPKIHRYLYVFGLTLSLCALPFSKFLLSVGLFTVVINWLIEGQWSEKLIAFKMRKSLWFFLLVYLSIFVSSFYSSNIGYTLKELKLWLPLLLLPIIIATSRILSHKEFLLLLFLFCFAVFISTIISFTLYIRDYNILGQDLRYLSPFISHIRFSLMINLAIFILLYLLFFKELNGGASVKILLTILLGWFVVFLFILQSFTGIAILFSVALILFVFWIFRIKNLVSKFITISIFALIALAIASYLAHTIDSYFYRNKIDVKSLPKKTINGNPYVHDTLQRQYENSNLVWINICQEELSDGWERLSKLYPNPKNKDYSSVEFGLIRYLTSKGLKKDSVGISKLDSIDFRLINNNVTSVIVREHKFGVYPRLYQLLWEIDRFISVSDPNGSTLFQRFIYIKASWAVIKKNILFGVGVGDGKDRLMEYYNTSNLNLDKKYWFISHNQYLTVWIASGLIGLFLFIGGLIIPVFIERKGYNPLIIAFLSIILLSMLAEDTLETHIGITFTSLFYSILVFGNNFSISSRE